MSTVGVIGTGTMGAGIAQVAAVAGWTVKLMDVDEAVATRAVAGIGKRLARMAEKGKLTADQRDAACARLQVATSPSAMADCDLIIEAVIEDMAAKVTAFSAIIPTLNNACVLATNTSSLSVTELGEALGESERLVGMHFFNPVPLLPLVEVVSGQRTAPAAADRVAEIAGAWGKTVVRCKDTPGFIVNRVARGFYLESLRILGEGIAGIADIDGIMKRLGGFRMGPFELMDLVGIDVNYTVSCSVYEQMGNPARLKPHAIQTDLYERKHFGRKTGSGFYSYEPPEEPVTVDRVNVAIPPTVRDAVEAFCKEATDESATPLEQYVFARVLVTIINEAAMALSEGVASKADIDTAMKTGTNYPHGPLEWANQIGRDTCRNLLTALNANCDDGRFEPATVPPARDTPCT